MLTDVVRQLDHFNKVLKQQEDGDCPFCGKRMDFTRGYLICDNSECSAYTKVITGGSYFIAMRKEVEENMKDIIDSVLSINSMYEGTLTDEKIEYGVNGDIDGTILSIKVNEVAWSDYVGKKVKIKIEGQ